MDMYKNFCKDCIQSKIGYKCDFHILDSSKASNGEIKDNMSNGKAVDVTIVSPIQAAVDQAESELRQEMYINKPVSSQQIQSDGNTYRGQNKTIKFKKQSQRRRPIVKRKVNKKNKKN